MCLFFSRLHNICIVAKCLNLFLHLYFILYFLALEIYTWNCFYWPLTIKKNYVTYKTFKCCR